MSELQPFAPPFRICGKKGERIESFKDWEQFAAPAGKSKHWKDYRSAKETARAWIEESSGPAMPAALRSLLDSAPSTKDLEIGLVRPEARLPLERPAFGGNTRNTDVGVYGYCNGRRTFAAVEAKADESFGQPLSGAWGKSVSEGSKKRKRLDSLCLAVFERPLSVNGELDPELKRLRYQLLHGLAGAVFEAGEAGAEQAVFAIHEFRSSYTKEKQLQKNQEAVDDFLAVLGKGPLESGKLLALDPIKSLNERTLPVYIGKVVTDLDARYD